MPKAKSKMTRRKAPLRKATPLRLTPQPGYSLSEVQAIQKAQRMSGGRPSYFATKAAARPWHGPVPEFIAQRIRQNRSDSYRDSESDTSSTSSQSENKNDSKKNPTPSDTTLSSDNEKYRNYAEWKADLLAINQQFVPKSTEFQGFLPNKTGNRNQLIRGTWKCTWNFTVDKVIDEVKTDSSGEDGSDNEEKGTPAKRMKKTL